MKANKNVCYLRCPWPPSWLLSGFVIGCMISGQFGVPPSLASVDYADPRLHDFQGRTSKLVKVKLTPLQGPECNAATRSRQCLCSENQLGNPLSKNCSFRDKHQCLLNEIHWPKVFYLACTCGFYLKKNLKTTNRWKMWTPTGVFVLNNDEDALTDLSLWKTAAFSILVLSCKALLWTRSRTRPSQRVFPLPFDQEVGCPLYLLNHTETALQTGPGWGRTLPFNLQLTTTAFSLPTRPLAAAHVVPTAPRGQSRMARGKRSPVRKSPAFH